MAGPYTKLDMEQVIKRSFDEPNDRLRVDAEITASIADVNVIIDAASGDNIKISDGVDDLAINPDGSINANVALDHTQDSVALGNGTALLSSTTAGSKVGLDVNMLNRLVNVPHDDIEIATKNDSGDPLTIVFRNLGTQVMMLTLTYDTDGDLQRVQRS